MFSGIGMSSSNGAVDVDFQDESGKIKVVSARCCATCYFHPQYLENPSGGKGLYAHLTIFGCQLVFHLPSP